MDQDKKKKKQPSNPWGSDDVDNVVDMAIFRMQSGAVVKEERTQKFKFVLIGAVAFAGLFAFSQLDFVYKKPVTETAANGEVTITLEADHAGHYLSRGLINGESVKFLVDTGATNVSIPKDVAKKLGLPLGAKRKTITANGFGTSYETRMESITLGGITLTDVDAAVSEGMVGDQILLGMSFLKRTRMVTDKGVLTITY